MASIKEVKDESQEEVQTYGSIQNHANNAKQLELNDIKNWSGYLAGDYPQVILPKQSAEFRQRGPLPDGSKGAVVYAEGRGASARKWLVAFHYPKDRVYVEAGQTVSSWDKVEEKLDRSGRTSSFVDPQYGGKADAQIANGRLVVTFSN